MSRTIVFALSAGAAIVMSAATFGNEGDIAKKKNAIRYYCPVAGMPETKSCCCPGGYCPLKPRADLTVEYKGGKIQLCCKQCEKIFKETPAKFAAVANHQLVATKQAQQVKCAMCGSDIGYLSGLDVAGITISFCSHDCYNNLKKLSPNERIERVFGNAGFARGFVMKSAKAN